MPTSILDQFQVAVPTAFHEDESLNVAATLAHIHYLANHGVPSVLVSGSTGEQHSLTLTEKLALLSGIGAETWPTDFAIIFGVASIRQREAVTLGQAVARTPQVAGALVGFPPYVLPTQQEAANYFTSISREITKPVIIYNNPRRTGFNLELPTFKQLLKLANVVGIKEAGDAERAPELRRLAGPAFAIYTGSEMDMVHKLALGFDHLSSVAGNLYPAAVQEWFVALRRGANIDDTDLQRRFRAIGSGSVLPFVKERITAQEQIPMGICRTPLGNF